MLVWVQCTCMCNCFEPSALLASLHLKSYQPSWCRRRLDALLTLPAKPSSQKSRATISQSSTNFTQRSPKNTHLCPKAAHHSLTIAHNLRPMAFRVGSSQRLGKAGAQSIQESLIKEDALNHVWSLAAVSGIHQRAESFDPPNRTEDRALLRSSGGARSAVYPSQASGVITRPF